MFMAHPHRWALAFLGFWVGGSFVRLDRAIAASATFPHRAAPLQADIHTDGADGCCNHLRATLAAAAPRRQPRGMFSISDADVAAIVAASERGGEWLAKIELRRLFP